MLNNKLLLVIIALVIAYIYCKKNTLRENFSYQNFYTKQQCQNFKNRGWCQSQKPIMSTFCSDTCNIQQVTQDSMGNCGSYRGYCNSSNDGWRNWARRNCPKTCGYVHQSRSNNTSSNTNKDPQYHTPKNNPPYRGRTECQYRATIGQCSTNPDFMKEHCKEQCEQFGTCSRIFQQSKNNPSYCSQFDSHPYCKIYNEFAYTKKFCTLENTKDKAPHDKINQNDPIGKHLDKSKCAYWTGLGYCKQGQHVPWMKRNCAKSCLIYKDYCEDNFNNGTCDKISDNLCKRYSDKITKAKCKFNKEVRR